MAMKVVLKNGETRWRERVTVSGKRLKVTGRTKEELTNLVIALKEKERKRRLGISEPDVKPDITYSELAEKVLDRPNIRESSVRQTRKMLKYSIQTFGTIPVRDITSEDVERWLKNMKGLDGDDISARTRGNALIALKTTLNYGVEKKYLSENVATKITKPAAGDAAHPFTSWSEVETAAEALGKVYDLGEQLVMFVAATGLRTQEWQVLRWSDFDLSIPCVTISRTMQLEGETAVGKTEKSLGVVALQERALEALRALPRPTTGTELLFPSPGTERPWVREWFRHVWKKALEDNGVEYRSPYQLRHTFATLSLERGVPLEWVSKQLRHTSIEMTRRAYARWTKKADDRWLAVLNTPDALEGDPNRLGDLLERLG